MPQNRWVSNAAWRPAAIPEGPVLPSLEAVYLTDPVLLAAVLPPPLEAPPEPRVHARVTSIDLALPNGHRHQEKVGFFAVDAALPRHTGRVSTDDSHRPRVGGGDQPGALRRAQEAGRD